MRALFQVPHVNDEKVLKMGNLIWSVPYMYPENELEEGIEQLKKKGYDCFLFPEGDGIAFNSKVAPINNYYDDFCLAFPWMQIVTFEVGQELNPIEINKYPLVIMPLWRVLDLHTSIHSGKFSIFPAGTIFPQMMNIKRLDGKDFNDKSLPKTLRDAVTETTKVDFEVFTRLPVIVFTLELNAHEYVREKHNNYDVKLIRTFSKEANLLFDIIRYYFCEYNKPEFLPAQPGLWSNQFSTALIYFPGFNCGFIQAGQAEVKTIVASLGMHIKNPELIQQHNLLKKDISETGYICQHALRLNTAILETDDTTLKFTQIMTLLEFLAYPNEYKSFVEVKKVIARHNAKDEKEYKKILDRFQILTSGIKEKDADGKWFIKEGGYREKIVHWGKRIEDVLPESESIESFFNELQAYVKVVINDMIKLYNLSWVAFLNFREAMKGKCGIK